MKKGKFKKKFVSIMLLIFLIVSFTTPPVYAQSNIFIGIDNVEVAEKEITGKKRTVSQRFDFYSRGLKQGDVINFIDDKNITAVVSNERQVIFESEEWFLSPLARELYTRQGNVFASGAYQGPAYFTYDGIKLTDLDIKERGSNEKNSLWWYKSGFSYTFLHI